MATFWMLFGDNPCGSPPARRDRLPDSASVAHSRFNAGPSRPPAQRGSLPTPGAYQFALAAIALVLVALLVAAAWLSIRFNTRPEAINQRHRLGVHTEPRLGTTRDLEPLLIHHPEPDRLIAGRWSRLYLATEGASTRRRRGIAGAVAVIGPSQSGKTTGLIDGLALWQGPPSSAR